VVIPPWIRRALGVSLRHKLLGANLVVLAIAAASLLGVFFHVVPGESTYAAVVIVALASGAVLNHFLVALALKPVENLQRVASRVAGGRTQERVPVSLLADPSLAQLGATMNEMLDNLAVARERMRKLAAEVVYAQERERAQVARDLHDSVGQTLAASTFQITAALNDLRENTSPVERLSMVREQLRGAQEEVRNVSRSLHPRVADDLGLPAALESLARATRDRSLLEVTVTIDTAGVTLPSPLAGTLFRVARESLQNVESHADGGRVSVVLYSRPGIVELEITHDGAEFRHGEGDSFTALDSVRERLSLAGGELRIDSNTSGGTRVLARITDAEAA
jgi:signal transduction histidine kinase